MADQDWIPVTPSGATDLATAALAGAVRNPGLDLGLDLDLGLGLGLDLGLGLAGIAVSVLRIVLDHRSRAEVAAKAEADPLDALAHDGYAVREVGPSVPGAGTDGLTRYVGLGGAVPARAARTSSTSSSTCRYPSSKGPTRDDVTERCSWPVSAASGPLSV